MHVVKIQWQKLVETVKGLIGRQIDVFEIGVLYRLRPHVDHVPAHDDFAARVHRAKCQERSPNHNVAPLPVHNGDGLRRRADVAGRIGRAPSNRGHAEREGSGVVGRRR